MNRTSISGTLILASMLLLSGALSAQNGVSKQPLPAFNNNGRWASSNGKVYSSKILVKQ